MLKGLFRTKNLDDILAAANRPHASLRRSLGPVHVTLLGIGAIIGAGIFATIGEAAEACGLSAATLLDELRETMDAEEKGR